MSTNKSPAILQSVATVGIATALAKIIGLAREIVLAGFYGVGVVSDAFILAFTIPDILLYFLSFSVASSFIPVYHRAKNPHMFSRNIMTFLLLIGLLFSTIFTFFPDFLVNLFAFHVEPETFTLAVYFVRYIVWSAVFILLSGIYTAQLEINGSFFSAGIRTIWRNAVVIAGIIIGALSGSHTVIALAPVIGMALGMVSLAVACRKHGYRYRPYLDLRSSELMQIAVIAAPMFLSTIATEVNLIINRSFAASLPIGSISSLNYSGKVQGLFVAIIGQSLFTVLFPYMSKLSAGNDIANLKKTLSSGIMNIVMIMFPLCIGVYVLAYPGIRILFQRGSFLLDDTIRTAECLQMYSFLMFFSGINQLLMRAFYATQNTKAPATISIITVLANITLNVLFIESLGAKGLALSNSISSFLTMLLLLGFLQKKIGHLNLLNNISEFIKIAVAAGVMGLCVWISARFLPLMSIPVWQSAFFCAVLAICSSLIYLILLLIFKSQLAFNTIITIIKLFKKKRTHTL